MAAQKERGREEETTDQSNHLTLERAIQGSNNDNFAHVGGVIAERQQVRELRERDEQ